MRKILFVAALSVFTSCGAKDFNDGVMEKRETPRFFENVKTYMLPKFRDVKFKDYATVDCVSGATISSKAVRENMKAAYDYYTEHK